MKKTLHFIVGCMFALLASLTLASTFGDPGGVYFAPFDPQNIGLASIGFALAGTIGLYDTTTLLDVMRVQKVNAPFWLVKGFGKQINFETDKVAFDRVSTDYRRRAPFVAPNVQGKVMTREGYDTLAFKPAYVKPKHVVDPQDVLVRQPGEALGSGSMTLQERRDAIIADILGRHKAMHMMTREWMAAKAIIDGKVDVEGEGYPKVTVDFRRDSSLTVVLAGAAKWDQTTATPLADLKSARATSNSKCGAIIRDIVFGSDAWGLFQTFDDVQELLSKQVRGSESDFTKMADGFEDTVEYLGTLQGTAGAGLFRMWLYSGKYKDETDTLTDILDSKTVVGVDWAALDGHRCFGAILDGRAGYQALDLFPKNWEDEDPFVEYIMTQSAPLMVPRQPNASFSIKVA